MTKKYTPRKEAVKIFMAIEDRLEELWDKLTSRNYNAATQYAYQIGFISDIEESLKKQKLIKNVVKKTNRSKIRSN